MSSHSQQQQQQQNQHQQQVATATAGFYPSTGYFQENKQLMSTTPNSVYCGQSIDLSAHSNVEQDMVNAVAAFSSPSLPPLSKLLPSSNSTTTQRLSLASAVSDNENNKTEDNSNTERSYSLVEGTPNNNIALTTTAATITPNVTPRPSIIYQPSPTVPSHSKIPSSHHSEMYYRPAAAAAAATTPNPVAKSTTSTNDPYYMTMTTYNATTTGVLPPTSNNAHHPLVFPPNAVPPTPTTSMHPSSIISSQSTGYSQVANLPSSTITGRISHSHHNGAHYQQQQQQHLPSPPTSYDQYSMEQPQSQKVFSFVSLPGVNQKKRPRRKYHEVERLYHCNYLGCSKSYGTLNHLNAHVQMQDHGPKRHPSEFKELRKMWRKQKRESQGNKKKTDSTSNTTLPPQQNQQQQQQQQQKSYQYAQGHQRLEPPTMPSQPVQSLIHHPLPPPPPLPTALYRSPSNHWVTSLPPPPPPPSTLNHPSLVQHQQQQQHAAAAAAAAAAGIIPNTINYQ